MSPKRAIAFVLATAAVAMAVLATAGVATSDDPKATGAVVLAAVAVLGLATKTVRVVWLWANRPPRPAPTPREKDLTLQEIRDATLPFWNNEKQERRINTPARLPISWSRVGASESGKATLLTEGDVTELYKLYKQLGGAPLVIVGDRGAGKTGALLLLLIEALKGCCASLNSGPLPVMLAIGDWDTEREELISWAARSVYRDNPQLTSTAFGIGTVEALLESQRLALFLDGFDELTSEAQHQAYRKLRYETRVPVVITSRPEAWKEVASETSFRGAAEVRLRPVSSHTARTFLLDGHTGTREDEWRVVAEHIVREADSPVARALNNPLWLSLARSAYSDEGPAALADWRAASERTRRAPSELCNRVKFTTVDAVRQHLIEEHLSNAFATHRSPKRARQTMVWLARGMGRGSRRREVGWWEIPAWTPWVSATASSVSFALSGGVATALVGSQRFGLILGVAWWSSGTLAFSGTLVAAQAKRFDGRALDGLIGVLFGLFAGGGVSLMTGLQQDGPGGDVSAMAYGMVFGIVMGVAGALIGLRDGPRRLRPRPPQSGDVLGALVLACIAATVALAISGVEAIGAIAVVAGVSLMLFVPVFGWTRPDGRHRIMTTPSDAYRADLVGGLVIGGIGAVGVTVSMAAILSIAGAGKEAATAAIMSGLLFGFGGFVTASRAAMLAVVGWVVASPGANLMNRLEAGRDQAVLRRVGGLYQFRHAEIQDYLDPDAS